MRERVLIALVALAVSGPIGPIRGPYANAQVSAPLETKEPRSQPFQELTGHLRITQSGFRFDRHTGLFVQTVELRNSLSTPIKGPVYFVVTDLSPGVTLFDSRETQNIQPLGSSYSQLELPDGVTLEPGESLALTLEFFDMTRTRINYTPKIFRTLGTP